uniref:RNase H type-1 domain-containing protein n=2 Tax=Cannabis sativa TaxID=3483 RepID=A0A803QUW1_CANSA
MNAPIIDPLRGDFPEVIEEYLEHGVMKCIAFNRRDTLLAAVVPGPCEPWKFPTRGDLKLNVYAAINIAGRISGVGAIVWSEFGHMVVALSKPLTGCYKAHEMEVLALFHSLLWASQLQLPINEIEINALKVSMAINQPSPMLSTFASINPRLCYLLLQILLEVVGLFSFFFWICCLSCL